MISELSFSPVLRWLVTVSNIFQDLEFDGSFLLTNCNQHDKMQLFAKFKTILRRGFRITLSF